MEAIGVPWFIAVRHLGPALFLLVAGGALVAWRRPPRRGLVWAALATNLCAAALPLLWIGAQVLTGRAGQSVHGLVMTLVQPLVTTAAWALLLVAVMAREPRRLGRGTPEGAGRKAARIPENIG